MKTNYFYRKLVFFLAFMVAFGYSSLACTFQLKMYDSYGDGWNGGTVTVYVNGTAVLSNQTVSTGHGPVFASFTVSTGDSITTDYTAGSWSSENEYWILDATGTVIAHQGAGSATPGDISTPIIAQCPVTLDAAMVSVSAGDCAGTRTVVATLKNFGLDTLYSATINWSVGGTSQTAVSWSDTLITGQTVDVPLGTYSFSTSTSLMAVVSSPNGSTDQNPSNDTATGTFTPSSTTISSFPYLETWESFSNGNITPSGLSNGWWCNTNQYAPQWVIDNGGTPSSSTGPDHDNTLGTSSGKYVYLETSGNYGSSSILTSPCLSLDSLNAPKLEFYYHMYGSAMGTLAVEEFVNGAWVQLWSISGPQQSSSSAPFTKQTVALSTMASKIRFVGTAGLSYTSDMAIDDIKIYDPQPNDLALIEWVSPVNGATPSTTMPVTVKVYNAGAQPQDTFAIKYSIDGGTTFVSETYNDTVNPGDTLTYTFTTTANMSASGFYNCVAVVNNPGDGVSANDTLTINPLICSPLSGVYTIGADTNDDFANFGQLATALAGCGLAGPVTVYVDSGTYDESVVFTAVNGASATNTITIKGLGDQTVVTNTNATSSNRIIFDFNGAKFFILDSLTIQRASGTSYFWGVHFMNQADSNTVRNCTIDCGSGTSSNVNGIVASASTTAYYSGGNNANGCVIDNNTILGGYYGITFRGTSSSSLCVDNHYTNNKISGFYYYGIYNYYQDGTEISGNEINSGSATSYYAYAIYAAYGKNALTITKNKINMEKGSYGLYLYRHNYYTPNQDSALVANNFIHVDRTSSGNGYGIYNYYSKKVKYFNNSVNITGNYAYTRAMYIYSTSSSGLVIKNNIFANQAGGYAIYSTSSASNYENDYNNLYTTGSKFCYQSGDKNDLTAWQTATSDAVNSVSVNPNFFSASDLHTLSIPMNDLGTHLSAVTDDIDGDTRSIVTPDIGADEYTPPANDLAVIEWLEPLTGIQQVAADTVKVKIANFGTANQSNFTIKYSVDGGQTFTSETVSATLNSQDTMEYTFTTTANFSNYGLYHCLAFTDLTNEQNRVNDTVFYDVFACSPFSGAYTLGPDTNDFFHSFADLAFALGNCGVSGPVTVYVDSGVYNENVSFSAVNGASATNTITINGMGNATLTNSNASYGNSYIINFDGAKHFILDSLNIVRDPNVNYFWGVHFMNQADSNTVRNCTIDCGTGTSSNLEGIVASGSLTSYNQSGNNANGCVIDNNTINGGYNGIIFRGQSSSSLSTDNHFTNNTLNNQYYYGIYNYYQDAAEISGNEINSGTQTSYYASAIYSGYGKNGLTVSKNKVDYSRGSYGIYLYRHNYYTPNQDSALVANNFIHVDRTSSGNGYGIYNYYSKKVKYFNNSVNITGNYAYTRAMYIYSTSSSGLVIKNNIFANQAGGYAIYSTSSASNYENDYNNLYTTGSKFCYQLGDINNLTAWQTATSDAANSISVDPEFFSDSDLHTFSIPMANSGTPLTEVSDDIDGESRNATTPDVGADEYTTPANNLGVTEIIYPFNSYCGANDSLYVVVKNFGTATQTNVPVSFVGSTPSGALSMTGLISSIASLEMDTVYMGVLNSTASGTYTGKAYATLATDTLPGNDTLSINGDVYVPETIGYSEDFSTWPPAHWDVSGSGTFTWQQYGGSYAYADFWSYTSGNTCDMSSPAVALPANKAAYLGFQYAYNGSYLNSYLDTLKVYARACGDADWTLILTMDSADLVTPGGSGSSPGTFMDKMVQIPASMQGSNVRIMFKGISDYGPNLYIDGMTVMNAPAVALGPDTTVCAGDTVTLDAGFFYGASYLWTKGADTVGTTQSIDVTATGTYVVHVTQFGVSGIDDITVTFNPLPSVSVTGLAPDYCENGTAATLSGFPVGGTFTGNGMVGNDFDPALAGLGNHDITYTYTDANGCTGMTTVSTMVKAAPVVTTSGNVTICQGTSTTLTASVPAVATDLFFSSYIEGSSNNKALEIFNGTGDTVYLADYQIAQAVNGNGWAYYHTFPAGAYILDGDVWVITTDQIDPNLFDTTNADEILSYPSVVHFNGDDARALIKISATDTTIIDIIGTPDNDPGAGWDVAGVSAATKNHTLVRKSTVVSPDTSWTNIAGTDSLSSQYLVYPQNTFTYLGSHSITGSANYVWSTGDSTSSTTVSPATTTDYYVTVTGANSCETIDTITVSVLAAPVVNLGADQALCASQSLTLDAGAGAGYVYMWNTGDTTQTINADSTGIGIGTGNYSVVVTDSNFCNGYDTIALTFMAEPVVNITGPDTVKLSWNATFDAGAGFATYLWSNGWTNQTILLGANTLTPGADTSFSVMVTNANGCYGYDTVTFYVLNDVGFGDNKLDMDLGIYPNPTSGKFTMEINGFTGELEMNVIGLGGKVVYSQKLDVTQNFVNKFDLSTLAKGVYYIKLVSKDGVKIEKLVIQ